MVLVGKSFIAFGLWFLECATYRGEGCLFLSIKWRKGFGFYQWVLVSKLVKQNPPVSFHIAQVLVAKL